MVKLSNLSVITHATQSPGSEKVTQTEEAELVCWNHLSGLGFVAEGVRLPLPSALSTAQLETSPSRTHVARPAELYPSGCENQEGRGDQAGPVAYRQEVWRSEPERTQLWSSTMCSVLCFCLHSCYLLCSILATLILEHQTCLPTCLCHSLPRVPTLLHLGNS